MKLSTALIAAAFSSLIVGCGGSEKTVKGPEEPPPADDKVVTTPAKKPDKKDYEYPPPDKLGSRYNGRGLDVGKTAPDSTVKTMEGKDITMAAARAGKPALVIFYRGGWCPYCNMQVHKMAMEYDSFAERGVMPIMISVDKPDSAAKTAATYEVKFPILSDPDLAAHKAYNVAHKVDADKVAKLKEKGQDLEKSSGRKHHTIAVPSMFLVDAAGVIKWTHIGQRKVRPSVAQLLEILDKNGFKAK